ncbi:MAG: hypothetical protein DI534_08800 [Leifsonia xyli]|nr:MAG: hypothetical protein DI534_08800 [Leifsonia xyli]
MTRLVAFAATALTATLLALAAAEPASATLPKPDPNAPATVLVNEVANGDAASASDVFFELRNWGEEAVDLTGWELYRCSEMGLRRNTGSTEGDLTGRVLRPGQVLTISRIGMPGDVHITSSLPNGGFGLYLENPQGEPVDMVGIYPNEPWPTRSECTPPGGNLPNTLDEAAGESWQRVAATGDPARDWVAAPATRGAQNVTAAPARAASAVVISEVAAAGPGGSDDDLLELRNDGAASADLSGWQVFRCTAEGRLRPGQLQLTIPSGTRLAPGESWTASAAAGADARWATSLADREFGVLVRDAAGALVDRMAVSAYGDSACQSPKLPAVLDAVADESYQRTASGWLVAARTPGRANATRDTSVFAETLDYPAQPGVAISELATDPSPEGMPAGTVQRNYVELGNYGDTAVEVGGWTAWRCMADGARAVTPQFTIPEGTVLKPGATFLAARTGTAAAADADLDYPVSLSLLGTGIWLADADGRRVDSVGVYAQNEMDADNVTASPCTKGAALTTYRPDRLKSETFQRSRFTGSDADDFVTRPATPGIIDRVAWVDPTARLPMTSDAPVATPAPAPAAPSGARLAVLAAWGGTSAAPLSALRGSEEWALDPANPGEIDDDGYLFPYQRLELDATGLPAGARVSWAGSTTGRAEVQLSAWDGTSWRLLDAASGPELVLTGAITASELRGARLTLLVQAGPRTEKPFTRADDGAFENPADYDLALSHITDTQYLTESYPEVYAQGVSWIAANADARKIAFATHTGDIIQNHVDPAQNEERARVEFERASRIQGILDDAGVANSVLPGNHDNIRGADATLFNEYFGPDRYAGTPWYGGSLAPDDNSANYSTFERAGAKFLMLSLPYAYAEREIAWAEQVVTSHPDYNVVLSTHEHVTPKTEEVGALRSSGSRWVSRADELWNRVIAPNRNVVLMLSGHFHGIGQIVTRNAGGIEGHTVVELLADYQEFRTETGERATGFQRLLQLDLASGGVAVDSYSPRLDADTAARYDYPQFVPDTGDAMLGSNQRPWRIVADGLERRYTPADEQFAVTVQFQYAKSVATDAVTASAPARTSLRELMLRRPGL